MERDEAWRANIITEPLKIQEIAASAKRIAVLGIKTEKHMGQPAFEVAAYLQAAGIDVIPVPVFYPEVTDILGKPVLRQVKAAAEGGPLDIVDVFRKGSDVPAHVPDLLAARPACVWLQSGIRAPEAEETLARAGIKVVADACLMVEHRRGRAAGMGKL